LLCCEHDGTFPDIRAAKIARVWEWTMRWFPKSIPFLVASVALYFVCYFGVEALRVMQSPIYGFEQAQFARIVRGIGRLIGAESDGLIRIAMIFSAVNMAIALLFATYLASRLCTWLGRDVDHEIIDAAVTLTVAVTVVAAIPAVFDGATDLLAHYRLPLWLAGLAVTLCLIERVMGDQAPMRRAGVELWPRVKLPPRRSPVSTLRWDILRSDAKVNVR
jgi:hypothetical protein